MLIPAHLRLYSSGIALLCGLAAAACSGSSPTSPAAATGAAPGAVIEGKVTAATQSASTMIGPSSASNASPSSMAGMSVRIVGTSVSAVVTDAGTFRLVNVPVGTARLQFTSASVNAATDLSNVAASEVIQIQVQVGPTTAVIVSQERTGQVSLCHAEGNGSYHLISVAPDAEPAHRAHGDGRIGDPVPGQPNKIFDESCRPAGPSIAIVKSTNGEDANNAPGPSIVAGSAVTWEYRVANTGTVLLTGIVVSDDQGVAVACGSQTSLAAGVSMTCTGAGMATLGQYRNVGQVTANWTTAAASGTVTDSDASHYLGIASTTEGTAKVTLCHKTGNTRYVEITVSVDAEPAHRAHGDAKIGEAVPGLTGKIFSTGCTVQ